LISHSAAQDGESNIFPGGSMELTSDSKVEVLLYEEGFLGEIVPEEDAEILPKLGDVMTLEVILHGEKYRYTQSIMMVDQLRKILEELSLETNNSNIQLQLAYYDGHSFRDGVNRISSFDSY
jgi:hypothetical protein